MYFYENQIGWFFNVYTMHLLLLLLQPTNVQTIITMVSPYTMYTPTCFDVSMSSSKSFTFVPH